MNQSKVFPRVMVYAEETRNGMTYFAPSEEVSIDGNVAVQKRLLRLCTGHHSIPQILATFSARGERKIASAILSFLMENQLVVNSADCWAAYHLYTCNPLPQFFATKQFKGARLLGPEESLEPFLETPFINLLQKRQSMRIFGSQCVDKRIVEGILWAAYGQIAKVQSNIGILARRTVPSAGGLYPLRLNLAVFKAASGLGCGLYELKSQGKSLVRQLEVWKKNSAGMKRFRDCFLETQCIESCAACVVVSANISSSTRKYADRGYRFAILEAGHSVQNILIFGAEAGIASIEIGGFLDSALTRCLNLKKGTVPLTTVCIGGIP